MVIEEAMLKFNVNNHPIEVKGGVLPGAELSWVCIVGYDRNRTDTLGAVYEGDLH